MLELERLIRPRKPADLLKIPFRLLRLYISLREGRRMLRESEERPSAGNVVAVRNRG